MMIDRDGFLSEGIEPWIQKHRVENAAWFALARRLNRVVQSVVTDANVASDDTTAIFAALLVMRGTTSFQAAVLLTERGMTTDARLSVRSVFESVFWLGALRRDPDFLSKIENDDISRRTKIARPLSKGGESSGLRKEQLDRLSRFLDSIEGSERSVQMQQAATLAGLSEAYDVFYRGLSNDAAHPSITALRRHTREADGELRGFRWGPNVDDVKSTLMQACSAIVHLIALAQEGVEGELPDFGEAWAEYKRLIELEHAP